MQSNALTVAEYLAQQPTERRAVLAAVRKVIRQNLDKGFSEGMQCGMIGYYVPHRLYPAGYHCDPRQPLPFAGLAAQKNYFSLYLMCLYGEQNLWKWFRSEWAKTGKKLDLGKACLRFKTLDDLALNVIAELLRRVPAEKFIAYYESLIKSGAGRSASSQAPASKKTPARKKATVPKPAIKASPATKPAAKPKRKPS